jgi:quercetin dioxygenase-like cupin family protein
MKRKTFMLGLAAVVATPAYPIQTVQNRTTRDKAGFATRAGEGRYHGHIQLKGVNQNILDVKVSGKDTNGDLAIFEQTSLSPGRGVPLHIHPNQDEIFYILDGEYHFQVGDQRHELKTGDSIFLPRNVPHAWVQIAERGKMTVTMQPAGKLEEFFVEMAALDHVPDQEEIARIFMKHEMRIVGPPMKVD